MDCHISQKETESVPPGMTIFCCIPPQWERGFLQPQSLDFFCLGAEIESLLCRPWKFQALSPVPPILDCPGSKQTRMNTRKTSVRLVKELISKSERVQSF